MRRAHRTSPPPSPRPFANSCSCGDLGPPCRVSTGSHAIDEYAIPSLQRWCTPRFFIQFVNFHIKFTERISNTIFCKSAVKRRTPINRQRPLPFASLSLLSFFPSVSVFVEWINFKRARWDIYISLSLDRGWEQWKAENLLGGEIQGRIKRSVKHAAAGKD